MSTSEVEVTITADVTALNAVFEAVQRSVNEQAQAFARAWDRWTWAVIRGPQTRTAYRAKTRHRNRRRSS